MSDHKIPLTSLERRGLTAHRLPIGTPSQLSDCFRHGMAWALRACDRPPKGWYCTREKGHEGPCAAYEDVV